MSVEDEEFENDEEELNLEGEEVGAIPHTVIPPQVHVKPASHSVDSASWKNIEVLAETQNALINAKLAKLDGLEGSLEETRSVQNSVKSSLDRMSSVLERIETILPMVVKPEELEAKANEGDPVAQSLVEEQPKKRRTVPWKK